MGTFPGYTRCNVVCICLQLAELISRNTHGTSGCRIICAMAGDECARELHGNGTVMEEEKWKSKGLIEVYRRDYVL